MTRFRDRKPPTQTRYPTPGAAREARFRQTDPVLPMSQVDDARGILGDLVAGARFRAVDGTMYEIPNDFRVRMPAGFLRRANS